ncbi:MarC family protein [Coxiella endosymbiont of Amblyomma americanum]|uniref:MarC family protein n=1 Tax=Coxiella endosymbiont of Amblyomma americanum TaxID=325775 RepID=UPI00057EC25E|nr:MarC family protein [Coxiella endosymbiont of Amblyomma americanum]AJC50452.1 membrane protein [Coxiella endosymbiont of Amblyomma americanum]AUJ58792.1 MarC family protein [Coxiella-like endosymbiont of Amblyomma americanum]
MSLYTIAMTLTLVMDPLGNIPVFLAILQNYDTRSQARIILRESVIAFFILVLFVFFGRYILHGLHMTTSALSTAGGVVLFIISLRMILPLEQKTASENSEEPLIVPLAVPLTAGPSAIAVVLLFVTKEPHHLWLIFFGILIASAIFISVMLLAPFLMLIFGKRGLMAIERLMGIILTTISVQMFLSGIIQYFHCYI